MTGDLAAYCTRFGSEGETLTPLNAALMSWDLAPAPSSPLRVFPVTTWIKLRAPLLGFLWNNRSYCNQILPSRKNFMQLVRTLHSQATEKSFFVLSLNTWNKLSGGGGALPGPTVERGFPRPNHIPACWRPAAGIFLRPPCGPISLELAVGWNLVAEGPQHPYGRMTKLRTTELQYNMPQDREKERA